MFPGMPGGSTKKLMPREGWRESPRSCLAAGLVAGGCDAGCDWRGTAPAGDRESNPGLVGPSPMDCWFACISDLL